MSRRRIVLMVVEGSSDANLLQPAFSALERGKAFQDVEFRCDVLTAPRHAETFLQRNGFLPKPVARDTVRELVDRHLRSRGLEWAQLGCIMQVCDLDGAFVPDDHIVQQSGAEGISYTENLTFTPDPGLTLADHAEKRRSADVLIACNALKGRRCEIPYRLFHVSRNLEHAFVGETGNLSEREKMGVSARQAARYAADPNKFRAMLDSLAMMHGSPASWEASWRYAMEGTHSLERGSNLAFAIPWITESMR